MVHFVYDMTNITLTYNQTYVHLHSPAVYGSPVPGIHEPPSKKSPTVNFIASVALVIT
ncbi:hypothetical protein Hanom_Chr12g01088671 [Helianthus anomalus]